MKASCSGILAVLIPLLSVYISPTIPKEVTGLLRDSALLDIIKIIASSMLLVTTFSLSTMVSAYISASQSVTPRAAQLLMEDSKSLNALSVFLGAFIFSIVTLIAISASYYSDSEKFVIFVAVILVTLYVVFTIIRWIEVLSKLGRVHETIIKIEEVTKRAVTDYIKNIKYGCNDLTSPPSISLPIPFNQAGYIQSISFASLDVISKENDIKLFINLEIGDFINPNESKIFYLPQSQKISETTEQEILDSFTIGNCRGFDKDPRFGFIALSEVASRALSPAVNDPGTAINIVSTCSRLVYFWTEELVNESINNEKLKYSSLWIKKIDLKVILLDVYRPLSRDGRSNFEVLAKVLKSLKAFKYISLSEVKIASEEVFEMVKKRGLNCLDFEDDKEILEQINYK